VWRLWWVGDAMGALLVAPVILAVATRATYIPANRRLELAVLAGTAVVTTYALFSMRLPLAYPVFPIIAWCALRFGQRETAVAMLLTSAFALWRTLHGQGPFALGAEDHRLTLLVTFLATVAMIGLLLGAMSAERRGALRSLAEANNDLEERVRDRTAEVAAKTTELCGLDAQIRLSEQQFRGAFETASHGMALVSTAGRWLKVNPALCAMLGYSAEELLATDFQAITHPDDLEVDLGHVRRLLDREIASYQMEKRYYHKDGRILFILLSVSLVRDDAGGPLHFVSQIIDMTEQNAIRDSLRHAIVEAKDANRAKTAFLTTMSHEIRTPMNGILGLVSLVLDAPLTPEQHRRVELIDSAGKSLMSIVNNVLDVAKIEAGLMEMECRPLNLQHEVSEAVSILRPLAAQKGLDLRFAVDASLPEWVDGDAARIQQVVLNLLNNAIKFTAHGGVSVTISREVGSEKNWMRIAVADSGPGIPDDHQARLFKEFAQAGPLANAAGTSGLGLSISKQIVEAMGGEIGMSSAAGLGSLFWFRIPEHISAQPPEFPLSDQQSPARGVARILVAEDILLNQIVIEGLLRAAGFAVTVVENGLCAVEELQTRPYDLVLMDMEMPILDGLAATRRIRGLNETIAAIPIIGLTANAFSTEREACLAAGMNEHLSKPISRDVLLFTVRKWLGHPADTAADRATNTAAEAIIVDPVCLAELEQHLGASKVAELAALFRENLAEILPILEPSANPATLGKAAHALSSLAGGMGCVALVKCCRSLVETLRSGTDDLPQAIADVTVAAQRARDAIDSCYAAYVAKSPFSNSGVGGSADEIAAHGDENHGLRDVDALLVVAYQAAPSGHPAESSLHHPAAGQDLETLLVVAAFDDLKD
ncbi:MAG: PAS domain S-box protein, partial [Bradyrhizobium sp.]|nr:PAS domain S-box protein [Bradyrhizobium sp.]